MWHLRLPSARVYLVLSATFTAGMIIMHEILRTAGYELLLLSVPLILAAIWYPRWVHRAAVMITDCLVLTITVGSGLGYWSLLIVIVPGIGLTALLDYINGVAERQRLSERRTRRDRKRIERLLAGNPAVVYSLTPEDPGRFRVSYISHNVDDVLGFAHEAFTQSPAFWRTRIHPADLDAFDDRWPTLKQARFAACDYRFLTSDGNTIWIHDECRLVHDPDTGEAEIVGYLIDVTASRRRDETLAESQRLITRMASAVPSQLYVLELPTGRMVYRNRYLSGLIGYDVPPEDDLGTLGFLWQYAHPEDLAAIKSAMQRLMRADEQDVVELHFRLRDPAGAWRWISTRNMMFQAPNADGVLQIVGVNEDVTKGKTLEQELAHAAHTAEELARAASLASRAKSDFLANMSHEIRTPMNAIVGLAELLLDAPLSDEHRSSVRLMIDSGLALLDIINDILDFSKIEAGHLALDVHDFSLETVVEGVADLLAIKARQKGLTLSCFVDPAIPAQLRGDDGRLRQILINLLSNAIKFTDSGMVSVEAVRESGATDGVWVRFTVEDTGIGISHEALTRLFRPFEQADSSTTRHYGGTGLGLAIVKRLVDAMGGQVDVNSRPGAGTTLTFVVPFEAGPTVQADEAPRARDGRVLIIDDLAVTRAVLTRYLADVGLTGTAVSTIAEALPVLDGPGRPVVAILCNLAAERADPGLLRRHAGQTPILWLTTADPAGLALASGEPLMTIPIHRRELATQLPALLDREFAPRTVTVNVDVVEPPGSPLPAAGPAILLAEDNPVNQAVAELQLRKLGYQIVVAHNGFEAVAAYEAGADRFALILMDCQMPLLDGFDATRRIRELEHASDRRIPIVAMTANAMSGDRELCLAAGMDDYLSKPVTVASLRTMLQAWLPAGTLVRS